jgi:ABC-type multidrug transport system fused ATPase/permease subunit
MATYRRLTRLIGDARSVFLVSCAIAAAQTVVLAPLALIVKHLFDSAIPRADESAIVLWSLAMLGLYLLSALLGLFARRLAVRVVKRSVGRLRTELLGQMYLLPQAWHDRQDARRLHATIVHDSERLDFLLTQLASTVVPSALILSGLTVVAAVVNPLLFAVLAAVIPVLVLAAKRLGGRTRRLVRRWHDAQTTFSADTLTALRTLPLSRVEGAERWELDRRTAQVDDVTARAMALADSQATYSIVQNAVAGIAGIVVLVVGGIAVARRSMTLGELLAFYAIGALILRNLAVVGPGVSSAVVSLEALERLDDLRLVRVAPPYAGTRRIDVGGAVAFTGVSFAHGDTVVLDGVDLEIEPGEHVALLGPNGAGKSTLVALLLGLSRPRAGVVTVDGIPLDELDLAHLRRQIGVVLQDAVLFPGTVRENIAYGRPEATDDEIAAAARAATADQVIAHLALGLESQVGQEGELLSGGEGQRIALARALLGAPRILVLDEPTTALDDAAVAAVLAGFRSLADPPTILTVTHDLDVAARADRVVHLRDGRIGPTATAQVPDRLAGQPPHA